MCDAVRPRDYATRCAAQRLTARGQIFRDRAGDPADAGDLAAGRSRGNAAGQYVRVDVHHDQMTVLPGVASGFGVQVLVGDGEQRVGRVDGWPVSQPSPARAARPLLQVSPLGVSVIGWWWASLYAS